MRIGWFEIRYLIAAPVTLLLLVQYAVGYTIWRRVFDRQETWQAYLVLGPAALLFAAQNVLYNVIVASFIFWDWPREMTTSDRLRRYGGGGGHWGLDRMVSTLNYFDPGHIVPDPSGVWGSRTRPADEATP